jgi:uncharacterized protein (TIGR02145 family)
LKNFNLFFGISFIGLLSACELTEGPDISLETLNPSSISAYSAKFSAQIRAENNTQILDRGFCWGQSPDPGFYDHFSILEEGQEQFQYETSKLQAGKEYFVGAFYITEADTIFGNQAEFETPDYLIFNPSVEYGTVTDIDGNVYKTITIGEQTWMAENLRTTRYQNGDRVEFAEDEAQWFELRNQSMGGYIFYNLNPEKKDIHGALYNAAAAVDQRNIAPEGWRVPTIEDWEQLIDFLDPFGTNNYGYKLRETTSAHWINEVEPWELTETNVTGFTALASGFFHGGLGSLDKGMASRYWTSSTRTPQQPVYVNLEKSILFSGDIGPAGYSIRCIKEN